MVQDGFRSENAMKGINAGMSGADPVWPGAGRLGSMI